jgi:hypothetical protein
VAGNLFSINVHTVHTGPEKKAGLNPPNRMEQEKSRHPFRLDQRLPPHRQNGRGIETPRPFGLVEAEGTGRSGRVGDELVQHRVVRLELVTVRGFLAGQAI